MNKMGLKGVRTTRERVIRQRESEMQRQGSMFRNYMGQDGTVDGAKMGIKLGVPELAEKIMEGLEGHTLKFRHQRVIKIVYYTVDKGHFYSQDDLSVHSWMNGWGRKRPMAGKQTLKAEFRRGMMNQGLGSRNKKETLI